MSGTLTFIEPLSYTEVVETAAAPAIDGTVDAGWAAANPLTTDKQIEGTGGATATIRTLWRENTLYVLAEVADPTVDVSGSDPWIQDSVEIFLDAGNYKNGSYRYDDTQIRISATNVVSFGTGDETFQQNRLTSATATVAAVRRRSGHQPARRGRGRHLPRPGLPGQRRHRRRPHRDQGVGRPHRHGLPVHRPLGRRTARGGAGSGGEVDSTVFGLPHTFIARRGTPIGYTAIVLSEGPAPTGTVTVYDRGTAVATATLPAGSRIATATIPGLSRGIHILSVAYSGSDLVEGSTSFPLPVLVF